ncbi:Serine/threonine-protein kinase [Scheffersomyces spartinae]|uniref:Serine/threonine-protein kinase ATG1 n=1 Tax=Scheffersomyces spartinae TaxID=45513 RepID=A0A9P7VBU6_9ASCO|nr:Serine/threonine-protein kinase [Scheffersomyces spartinae]KAG7195206.1 Serine/threonine-protein kinase [Scheffersomyces spartinae]
MSSIPPTTQPQPSNAPPPPGTTKTVGNYSINQEIGRGSFATVYKSFNIETHHAVAIKAVVRSKLKSKKLMENLEIEISILKNMKHPHIVGLLDYYQTANHFYLVMDYCSMGDLSYFIRKKDQLAQSHPVIQSLLVRYPSPSNSHGLNQTLVIHFLKQLSSALEFLRSKSLVHRDIKPQNLLLCPPIHLQTEFEKSGFVGLWELPILKIADFGFARFLPSTSMAETLCGSPLYMAPEILRYEKYNAKADLWSVGAVLFQMTVGRPPFKAVNHMELLKNIERSNDKIKFPSLAQVPDSLKNLIRALLKCNPTERISFNEFFSDPLITSPLEGNNKPLDASEVDENLYISEYISPMSHGSSGANNNKNYITPIPINENDELKIRDEEIKEIINNNSPSPDNMAYSIQKYQTRKQIGGSKGGGEVSIRNKDDIILEKDYVVVEKRAVEVNAIADELAHAGSGALAIVPSRRKSSTDSTGSMISNSHAGIMTNLDRQRKLRSSSESKRRPSFADRRISISISPTTALNRAIGLASNRLFGTNNNNNNNNSSKVNNNNTTSFQTETEVKNDEVSSSSSAIGGNAYYTVISSPTFANNLLLQRLNLPNSLVVSSSEQQSLVQLNNNSQGLNANGTPLTKDEMVLNKLETIATMSHAINLFADVKFSQLIPIPPSIGDGLDDDLLHQNDTLPPRIIKNIAEEGVVLYVKTLSILAKGMTIASDWWYEQQDDTSSGTIVEGMKHTSLVLSSGSEQQRDLVVQMKINSLVQWIREKFNDALGKADFIRLRLEEANLTLSKEQRDGGGIVPGLFDEESPKGELEEEATEGSVGGSSTTPSNRAVAEKLIFDRALEMSRNAAVNELVKEDLKGCELAYSTAIWMLESILDDEDQEEKLDDQDRAMIEKFIVSIGNRLAVLKKKLELM